MPLFRRDVAGVVVQRTQHGLGSFGLLGRQGVQCFPHRADAVEQGLPRPPPPLALADPRRPMRLPAPAFLRRQAAGEIPAPVTA